MRRGEGEEREATKMSRIRIMMMKKKQKGEDRAATTNKKGPSDKKDAERLVTEVYKQGCDPNSVIQLK